jgi:hypothetical protein
VFEFTLTQKIWTRILFSVTNIFNSKPMESTEILIYAKNGQVIEGGLTNMKGEYETKLELGSSFKIYTKKEGYVDLYQEFLASTSAITEKVHIRLIPKSKEPSPKFEIITTYKESLYNVALHAVCPDGSVINEKHDSTPHFKIKYDEIISG